MILASASVSSVFGPPKYLVTVLSCFQTGFLCFLLHPYINLAYVPCIFVCMYVTLFPPAISSALATRSNTKINLLSTLYSSTTTTTPPVSIYSETHSYPSYLGQILMDLQEIFSIGPQGANRHKLKINFIEPHLPKVVMTYHDHSHSIKTNLHILAKFGCIFMKISAQVHSGQTDRK